MKLDQYLSEKGISTPAFADSLGEEGMDASFLWRIRHGKVRPGWKTIDAIVKATNGAVMPNDFLSVPEAATPPLTPPEGVGEGEEETSKVAAE
jgi:hypothetical protein